MGMAVAADVERPMGTGTGTAIAIEALNLGKVYPKVKALDGVSFTVARGEIFSLLGHNGAGKTTTIKILTGRARPTTGGARVLGYDVARERERMKPLINLVSDEQNLYERMSGRDNLLFFASLYRVRPGIADELIRTVGLTDSARRLVKTYSSGMKQRLLVARALINQPEVLFLDEPTAGLDPASAKEVRVLVKSLAQAGTTIFLTTHYMEEADELSDRVAFISQGRIVALDSPRELKLRYGNRTASILLRDRHQETVSFDDPRDAERVATWMRDGSLLTIHSQEGTLEDVFIALAGRPLN